MSDKPTLRGVIAAMEQRISYGIAPRRDDDNGIGALDTIRAELAEIAAVVGRQSMLAADECEWVAVSIRTIIGDDDG